MNKEVKLENVKEDSKAIKKFCVVMAISLVVGFFGGFFAVKIQRHGGVAIADSMMSIMKVITPYASLVFTGVSIIAVTMLYRWCRKKFDAWDQEDEDCIDKIDEVINYAMYISNVALIVSLFFFAAGLSVLKIEHMDQLSHLIPFICWFGSFFLTAVFTMIAQKKLIDLTKEMNPEKKGSIYDTQFAKKWEESCDEAEKLMLYKAAYKAYGKVATTCMALWLVCVVGSTLWNFGIVPVAMVTIIWFVQITSYTMEANKLSKRK